MFDREHKRDRAQMARLADDLGTDPATVRELLSGAYDAPERLRRMLRVCGYAPEAVLANRRIGQDLERVCSACQVRARCGRWLKRAEHGADAAPAEVPDFCPNRGTFAEIAAMRADGDRSSRASNEPAA